MGRTNEVCQPSLAKPKAAYEPDQSICSPKKPLTHIALLSVWVACGDLSRVNEG